MQTTAVRLYGKRDLRLETFELPPLSDDNILAAVISDSICMSTYKTAEQGAAHKRVPDDVAEHPVIIGHEMCGVILEVGRKWRDQYHVGDRFAVQPVVDLQHSYDTIGYSFSSVGGDSERVVIPNEIIEHGCLLPYSGAAFAGGSLAEPVSCIVGGFRAFYHSGKEEYTHEMGLRVGGRMAIFGGTGPMGLGAIDCALHGDRRPGLLVVTDINAERLARAAKLFPPEAAARDGMELVFLNTAEGDAARTLMEKTGGKGFDDILCMAPVRGVVELADKVLGRDGCLNFFAGPMDAKFAAEFNFYNVHYASTHVVGTSGGTTNDLRIALRMMAEKRLRPEVMITHIGGLDAVIDTTLNLPAIPGGKKIIYPGIRMPLTAIADFAELGRREPLFAQLASCCENAGGLWNADAERILLKHFNIL